MASWSLVGVDTAGREDFGATVTAEPDLPAISGRIMAGFDDPVVMRAHKN